MDTDLVLEFEDAVNNGSEKRVKQLLKLIPDLNHPDLCYSMRPLFRALDRGHLEIAELLVAHGADVNRTMSRLPLLLCSFTDARKREVAFFLLRHGAKKEDCARSPYIKEINEYTSRPWCPANHLSWPTPFRKQALAVLCALRRKRIPSGAVVLYLLPFVIAAYFH